MNKPNLMGLETEYGITIENQSDIDPTAASQLFFNLWRPANSANWDFATESPSQDARGWLDLNTPLSPPPNAALLASPATPAQGIPPDRALLESIALLDRTNLNAMLGNGARFYIDHAHPEYSTPECVSLRDLIAADVAGQVFLAQVAAQASTSLPKGQRFSLYRNNTDFHGASYGCHENYLMSADTYTMLFGNRQHRLFTFLIPFLVTRQIFCGAGKVGAEAGEPVDFQISQRADFIETVLGLQTVYRRPIVNTRDEPHADPQRFRRLHVILGDANMAEHTTYLKVGCMRLVLDMLAEGWVHLDLTLEEPVAAIKAVARDLTCCQPVICLERERKRVSALDIQSEYLQEARRFLDACGSTPEQEAVWSQWEETLLWLQKDPLQLARRIDWIIKRQLLEGQMAKRGIGWDNPLVKELDIKYHAIAPERSAYHLLRRNQLIDSMVTEAEVQAHLIHPPPDTRAALRAQLIAVLGPLVLAVNWDSLLAFNPQEKKLMRISLPDPTSNGGDLLKTLSTSGDPLAAVAACLPIEVMAMRENSR